jgi:uncharacterized protein YggE
MSRDDATTVTVSVTSRAGTAKETAALNTDRIQKLLEVVKASTPEAKITSKPLAQFHPPQNMERGVGQSVAGSEHAYTAQNELLLQLASVAQVAEVVDEAKSLGADHLESVTFDLRDPSGAQTEAVRRATVEAQQMAHAEATALGLKLRPLVKSAVAKSLPASDAPGGSSEPASSEDSNAPLVYRPPGVTVSADVTLTYAVQ